MNILSMFDVPHTWIGPKTASVDAKNSGDGPSEVAAAQCNTRPTPALSLSSQWPMGARLTTPSQDAPVDEDTVSHRPRPSLQLLRVSQIAPFNGSAMSLHSSNFTSRGSVSEGMRGSGGSTAAVVGEVDLPTEPTGGVPPVTIENAAQAGSNRSLLGGLHRRLSNSTAARVPPAVVSELWKELSLVKRNILSNKPWIDGFSTMWIVISNTITSVMVGWCFAFVYAIGSPTSTVVYFSKDAGYEPTTRVSLAFAITLGVYFVGFACLGHAITKSFILAERLHSIHIEMRHTFINTLLGYVRVTGHVSVVMTGAGAMAMALFNVYNVDVVALGRVHVPVLCAIAGLYIDYAVRDAHRLRRLLVSRIRIQTGSQPDPTRRHSGAPSAEAIGAALDSSAAVIRASAIVSPLRRFSSVLRLDTHPRSSSSCFHRLVRGGRWFAVTASLSIFGCMHLSLVLPLVEQWQVVLFTALSLVVKIAIQEATKRLYLQATRKPSARSTHMIMTVPTVMIDAQIRMVLTQLSVGTATSSTRALTNSLVIVVCKIVFRLVKILKLRATVKRRLGQSKGMQRILKRVNSKIALRDVATARAEYAQFLDWKNHMLRLHAAEVYADMHGEYISIGVAMGIVFFWTNHPMYDLHKGSLSIGRQMESAGVQLGVGLLFDYIASVVEGVHEVPLYEAIGDEGRGLRVFMHVLLAALTTVNVGAVALFMYKVDPSKK